MAVICYFIISGYIRADWGRHGTLHTVKPRLALHMPKISDIANERVPSLRNRISSFQSKLTISHYAHSTITDYCHVLYKAVVYIGKLPDDFSQDDVDGYLQSMLSLGSGTAGFTGCILTVG